MPAEPKLVRILEIVEENFGTEIHIKAIAETEFGDRLPLPPIRYGALDDVVRFNRANAYDELFARVYARASVADVEAAKRASKEAATASAQQIPVILDDELAEQALANRRVVPPHWRERVERLADARVGGDAPDRVDSEGRHYTQGDDDETE